MTCVLPSEISEGPSGNGQTNIRLIHMTMNIRIFEKLNQNPYACDGNLCGYTGNPPTYIRNMRHHPGKRIDSHESCASVQALVLIRKA